MSHIYLAEFTPKVFTARQVNEVFVVIKVPHFLKKRERYKIKVSVKQAKVPSPKSLLYNAGIDQTILKSLFIMGMFDFFAPNSITVKNLTDEQIKTNVESLISHTDKTFFDGTIIESALFRFVLLTKNYRP